MMLAGWANVTLKVPIGCQATWVGAIQAAVSATTGGRDMRRYEDLLR
jgi:hypothetical protein